MSKHQGKSGSRKPRKPGDNVVSIHSTVLGRRIAALEIDKMKLEGQRTLLVRAVGALAMAVARQNNPDTVEPAIIIPFDELNMARDVGLTIAREGPHRGLQIVVVKPVRPDEVYDSESAIEAMVNPDGHDADVTRPRPPKDFEVDMTPDVDGGFVGVLHTHPGCITQGKDADEIRERMLDAIDVFFDLKMDDAERVELARNLKVTLHPTRS